MPAHQDGAAASREFRFGFRTPRVCKLDLPIRGGKSAKEPDRHIGLIYEAASHRADLPLWVGGPFYPVKV